MEGTVSIPDYFDLDGILAEEEVRLSACPHVRPHPTSRLAVLGRRSKAEPLTEARNCVRLPPACASALRQ